MKLITGFSGEQSCVPRPMCSTADTAAGTAEGKRVKGPWLIKKPRASIFKEGTVNDNTGDFLISAGQVKLT